MPTSPGRSRSCQGTQAGASSESAPGSRTLSSTVTTFDLGARVTVTAHRHPVYPGSTQRKKCVTTRSAVASTPR